ncbi:DUF3068 domain-containing protein [Nocardiopsis sp. MG754419]|uniref:DUF3068 domain-containing protein n=1 Tax=Nocardiopsis sp. MG754419 TaxID=2259865 RepID=UPI001BA5CBC7|nr:DUF3068 domain-containing protein [Nocardiopsis sp. MG754419]MBR8743795.1 DUF3068 domain-containing protein [Nocardiopsis sp. MG754419]
MSAFSQMGRAPVRRPGPRIPAPARPLPRGTVLVAVGAFLVTVALLLPLYVHDRVALMPGEVTHHLRMNAPGAAYLDAATWTRREGVELTRTTRVEGTSHGAEWSAWEMTVDTTDADRVIDHWSRRVIVDRATGRAVNCCGEHVDGDRAVRQAGLVLQWPAGAPEGDHSFYDAEVRAAPAVTFDEDDEIGGLAVRRYVQELPATQVPESSRDVPADLFGDEGGTVPATLWLAYERTFWVEPVTGRVVHMTEDRTETLRPQDGSEEVALLEAEFALAEGQVSALAEQARVRALVLRGLDAWVPWTLGPLGVVAILAGLFQARRARSEEPPGAGATDASDAPATAGARRPVPTDEHGGDGAVVNRAENGAGGDSEA